MHWPHLLVCSPKGVSRESYKTGEKKMTLLKLISWVILGIKHTTILMQCLFHSTWVISNKYICIPNMTQHWQSFATQGYQRCTKVTKQRAKREKNNDHTSGRKIARELWSANKFGLCMHVNSKKGMAIISASSIIPQQECRVKIETNWLMFEIANWFSCGEQLLTKNVKWTSFVNHHLVHNQHWQSNDCTHTT